VLPKNRNECYHLIYKFTREINIYMDIVKKVIFKTGSFFRIPLNYKGLRVETTVSLKNIYGTAVGNKIETVGETKKRYVFCLGDSNTFGWNYMFKDSYPKILENILNNSGVNDVGIINLGKGGSKIEDLDVDIDEYIKLPNILAMILGYGLNDLILETIYKNYFRKNGSNNYDKNYDIDKLKFEIIDLKEKYNKIIKKILMRDIKVIILGLYKVKKTKIFNKWVSGEKSVGFQNRLLDCFNDDIKSIAINNNTDFIDVWDILETDFSNEDYLQKDGFHLNKMGFETIAEKVNSLLLKYIKEDKKARIVY